MMIPIFIGGVLAINILIVLSNKSIYLYAWERPEDFSFLKNSSNTSVVFYAGDVVIKNKRALINFRRNPLSIPDDIQSFPLIRIDSFDSPNNFESNLSLMSDFIVKICKSYRECHIDFEARTSEYSPYSELLKIVDSELPNTKILITALASWCSDQSWFDDANFEAAIPMFYRMGKDSLAIKKGSVGSWFLSNPKCSDNIALSTDELDFNPRRYMRGRSVYLFNPNQWTAESYKNVISYLGL
ncbi:MAG: hypothetical protein Q7S83_04270 [bacterium]|nr:hypothetical protein [bacterium]